MKQYGYLSLSILLTLFLIADPVTSKNPESNPEPGKGLFVIEDEPPLNGGQMNVYYYLPEGDLSEKPILFVMHGTNRNADDYRDNWVELADKHGIIIIAPEFSNELFPGADGYNLGGMFDDNGEAVDEEYWGYSMIEPIFDRAIAYTGSNQSRYDVFGHSAGSQFTHRFFLFKKDLRVNRVVASNAGWYTMPDFETEFPYGLKGTALSEERLLNRLGQHLVIQLGENDNDPEARFLRNTDGARAQGAHRYERGHTFYDRIKRVAEESGREAVWSIRSVPEVGHDNARMAIDAASYLYGD
ncbi:MAG: hypothetical protein JJU46_02335 [Balneolaceae bacterium]|nr:hypothetical protein [Balneolaceae bacterium]MCH8548718.1 hypothetical protein [Balneolaceae bacterium]